VINGAQDRQNGQGAVGGPETSAPMRFTPREREVLALLCQGKPNKIIAHALNISENTVKVFVRRILMKLNATNHTAVACLTFGPAESEKAG
jgi:DNA-binding NarL/FixJ family response regulator